MDNGNDDNNILLANKWLRPSKGGGFVKQAAILGGASIFVRLMGFFYRVPLTNLIGDDGNAFYGTAYQVYVIILNLTSVFMIAAISRLASERIALGQFRNAHTLFKTAMAFSMIIGTMGSLAMFFGADIIVTVFNFDEVTVYAIRSISPAIFIVSMLTVLRGYFQGMKTTFPTAISQVIEQIFNISFSLWLAFLFFDAANIEGTVHFSAAGATAGTAIAALAALSVVTFIYMKVSSLLKKRAAEDPTEFREKRCSQIAAIIRTSFPIMLMLTTLSFFTLIDISMANNRLEASSIFSENEINVLVGQFIGKFVLLTTLPVSLSMALSAAIIPEITAAHVTGDKDAVRQKTNLALRLSMMLSIPAAVGLAVLADPILAMLFPMHPEGGWLLRYGSISIIFMAIFHVITGVLQGVGHVKLPLVGVFFGGIAKCIINYVFMVVPQINILGAVISTIVCFIVAAAVNLFFLYRYAGIFPSFTRTFFKPTIAALGMGLVCFFVYNLIYIFAPNIVATLCAIAVGGFSYVFLMVIIRGLGERDIEALPIPRKIKNLLGYGFRK